jgi:hypothetical protein
MVKIVGMVILQTPNNTSRLEVCRFNLALCVTLFVYARAVLWCACVKKRITSIQPRGHDELGKYSLSGVCRQCEAEEPLLKLVPDIVGADPMAAALLVECRGQTPEDLQVRLRRE